MKAVRITEDGTWVEVADVDAPRADDDAVLVRVAAAGICGTDLHILGMGILGGRIPGHELAGYAPDGRPVAIEPVISCQTCEFCLRGDNPLCLDALPNLIGVGLDGGMAEAISVPAHLLVELPTGLAVENASLVEPVAVSVRGLLLAGVRPGDHIAVVGGGTIGLCAVAAALQMGATAELVARHEHQRVAGERLGASPPGDRPCEVVVDAAGTASSLADSVQLCARGGTVLVVATYWDPTELPGTSLSEKEVRLVHSIMYGRTGAVRDMDTAAGMVARTPELARAIITHRFPLDAGPQAFEAAADRSSGAIKVVLEP
ncbi:MAG: zinc-dependent alcohol dehydrogenase [Acidimicrobiales bacterium]